jgi:GR25 family glycosyltransferase involved in LPS biosynthesis
MIEHTFCISLLEATQRRARLDKLLEAAQWNLPSVNYINAVRGTDINKPKFVRVSLGAWGCFLSHLKVLDYCISKRINTYLMLEDDAYIPHNFNSLYADFMEEVPRDWEMLFLGGQHLNLDKQYPAIISPHIVKCHYLVRAHAYVVRNLTVAHKLRKAWTDFPWDRRLMFTHTTAKLISEGNLIAYAPNPFIIAQNSGVSSVTPGAVLPVNYWNLPEFTRPVSELSTSTFNIVQNVVGRGKCLINTLDYSSDFSPPNHLHNAQWSFISAQTPSTLDINLYQEHEIVGCTNATSTYNPSQITYFDCDNILLGYTCGPNQYTSSRTLSAGVHRFISDNSEHNNKHTLWALRPIQPSSAT